MSPVLGIQLHSSFRGDKSIEGHAGMRFVVVVSLLIAVVASCASRSSPGQATPQDAGIRYCSDTGSSLPGSCVGGDVNVVLTTPHNLYTTFAVLAESDAKAKRQSAGPRLHPHNHFPGVL